MDEKRIRLSKQYLSEIEGDVEQKRLVVSQDLEKKANKQIARVADYYAQQASSDEEEEDEEGSVDGKHDERSRKTLVVSSASSSSKTRYGKLYAPEFRKGHLRSCTSVCVRKDGEKIYSGGKDCAIIEWDLESGKKVVFSGARKRYYY